MRVIKKISSDPRVNDSAGAGRMKPACRDARGTGRHSAFAFSGCGLGYVVI